MNQNQLRVQLKTNHRRILPVLISLAFLPAVVQAQSDTVTIYGSLDIGVNINKNTLGAQLTKLEQRHEPSNIGFRGREDLGQGLAAIFQLEGSVAVDSGNFTFFDKQSYVGLSHNEWGTLTLGRNSDSISDLVPVDPPRYNSVTAVHVGNLDRTAGNYLNNSVRYRSIPKGGLNFSAIYSVKEDGTSTTNTGNSGGFSVNYIDGPLRVSAAALEVKGLTIRPFNALGIPTFLGVNFANQLTKTVTINQNIAGIGASYDVAGWRMLGEATQAKLSTTSAKETLNTYALGVAKDPNAGIGLRPAVGVNRSTLRDSSWTTTFAILDYYLTKRTDVYLRVVGQKASGPDGQRAALYLEGPSSNKSQTVYGFGVTHRF